MLNPKLENNAAPSEIGNDSPPEHPLFEGQSIKELSKKKGSFGKKIIDALGKNPTRLMTLSFAFVILTGALLLMLPIASRSGEVTPFLSTLFTATSATCVTGLILFDTMTYWSFFGQVVIISLIQIGGLSLLTILSAFSLRLHRQVNLSTTRALQDSTAGEGVNDTLDLVKKVVSITLSAEAFGAVLLIWRYSNYMPLERAIWKGTFQAISAFCNAGFDLMGDYSGPFTSLSAFNGDPLVLVVTASLIISGGLGFVVWDDLFHSFKRKTLSFHSRLVLRMTALLLIVGALFFFFHPGVTVDGVVPLNTLPLGERINAAFFQSATLRTAGFNSVDQASLSDPAKVLSSLWMMIGAAPASTGGGIKVTSFAIAMVAFFADLRKKGDHIQLMQHHVKSDLVRRSFVLFFFGIMWTLLLAFFLSLDLSPELAKEVRFTDLLFEATSAFGTVGLSSVGTSRLSSLSHIALLITMYIGRVGPASLALSFMTQKPTLNNQVLPEGKTVVG